MKLKIARNILIGIKHISKHAVDGKIALIWDDDLNIVYVGLEFAQGVKYTEKLFGNSKEIVNKHFKMVKLSDVIVGEDFIIL